MQNSPFIIVGTGQPGTQLTYKPNPTYSKAYGGGDKKKNDGSALSSSPINVVKIPKNVIGFVNVGSYTMAEDVDHMPLVSITNLKDRC